MDFKKHEDLVSQMIKKLVSGDYHTAKGAAANIIAGVYPCKFDPQFFIELYSGFIKLTG